MLKMWSVRTEIKHGDCTRLSPGVIALERASMLNSGSRLGASTEALDSNRLVANKVASTSLCASYVAKKSITKPTRASIHEAIRDFQFLSVSRE